MTFDRGTFVLLNLDPTTGHEQRGTRPCIIVSDPDVIAGQRFPLMGIVPVTGTLGSGALYPALQPGPSGLVRTSYALVDHVRSVDKRRVRRVFGRIRHGSVVRARSALQRQHRFSSKHRVSNSATTPLCTIAELETPADPEGP